MENQTIAQIVTDDYRTATIFKKFGLDFCCGGKKQLAQTCKEKGIDKEALLKELKAATEGFDGKDDAGNLELDNLADYIVQKHHSYVKKRIPEIEPFLAKVVNVHGDAHLELVHVQRIFLALKEELYSHMMKEENVLFPYIREMVRAKREKFPLSPPSFATIKNPINMMEQEHEIVGNGLKEIRKITNNLTPPENACNTYRVIFFMLDEFENDLLRHIHLENNVLFPKAISLEEWLVNSG